MIKSSASIILLPKIVNADQRLLPSIVGSDKISNKTIFITAIFRRLIWVSSNQKDIMFSNTAITVENAANTINKKNRVPIILPTGIELNMLERVVNKKLAPTELASAVTPLL